MANRSSDRTSSTPAASPTVRGGRAVFIVATDPAFLDSVLRECEDAPAGVARYSNLDALSQALGQLERIQLAFVLLVEHRGADLDIPALRHLRLSFPQLVILSVLEGCDQQTELRLHSIGVQASFATVQPHTLARDAALCSQFQAPPRPPRLQRAWTSFPSDFVRDRRELPISNLLKEFGFPPQDTEHTARVRRAHHQCHHSRQPLERQEG
jgi:hypothetical protein